MRTLALALILALLVGLVQAEEKPSDETLDKLQALHDNGQFEQLRTEALTLLKNFPNDESLLLALAQSNIYTGRMDDAKVQIERLLKIKPKDPGYHTLQAAVMMAQGETAAAVTVMEKALAYSIEQGQDAEDQAKKATSLMVALYAADQAEQAHQRGKEFLKTYPEFIPLYASRAGIYADQKDYKNALKIARRGLQRDPNSADLLFAAGGSSYKLGDKKTAEEYYKLLKGKDEELVYRLRAILDGKKDPAKSE